MKMRKFQDLMVILRSYYWKYQEVINYVFFGGLTTLVSIAVKYGLLFTVLDAKDGIQLEGAVMLSWIAACTFAYVTNRRFVFKSKSANIAQEAIKFFGARLSTLGLEAVLMWLFITAMGMNSDKEVVFWTLVVQVLVIVANYFLSKFLVFNKKEQTQKAV